MAKGLEAVLSVENIRIKANHGWYREERIAGGMYTVSVHMYHRVAESEQFKTLESSVNYELIYASVVQTMKREFHLIEEACRAVYLELKQLDNNSIWEVELSKEEPPLKYVERTKFVLRG